MIDQETAKYIGGKAKKMTKKLRFQHAIPVSKFIYLIENKCKTGCDLIKNAPTPHPPLLWNRRLILALRVKLLVLQSQTSRDLPMRLLIAISQEAPLPSGSRLG